VKWLVSDRTLVRGFGAVVGQMPLGYLQAVRLQAARPLLESGDMSVHTMPARADFRCGEKVSFDDKYLQSHFGLVIRINQRTATVGNATGTHGEFRSTCFVKSLRPTVNASVIQKT
jgi:transcriptional regulator GlxA family with amidase domain